MISFLGNRRGKERKTKLKTIFSFLTRGIKEILALLLLLLSCGGQQRYFIWIHTHHPPPPSYPDSYLFLYDYNASFMSCMRGRKEVCMCMCVWGENLVVVGLTGGLTGWLVGWYKISSFSFSISISFSFPPFLSFFPNPSFHVLLESGVSR